MVQWLPVVYSFSGSFGWNVRCKRVIKFVRSIKEAHLRFLDFKNLKIYIETKRVRAQDSLIRPTSFEGKVQ